MTLLQNFFTVLSSGVLPYAPVANHFAVSAGFNKTADFTGDADGKQGILNFWINASVLSGVCPVLLNGGAGNIFLGFSGAAIHIYGADIGGNQRLGIDSTTNTPLNVWNNYLIAWDLNANFAKAYLNDVHISSGFEMANNATLNYTGAGWTVGEAGMVGCLSEVYFAPNQFLDITVEANRRKFITADLKAVDLGATGSLPTGTAPLYYMKQNGSNRLVNSGSGGDFDSITGTVIDCLTFPPGA